MGFQTDMDKTRDAVAQLTAWCVLVALHQDLGEGAARLDRVAAQIFAHCMAETLRAGASRGAGQMRREPK